MAHAYVEATNENVNDLVASGKVVVDAFADWCGPCRGIAPKFAAIAAEYAPKGLTFVKVNVDELEAFANKHNISALPSFLFFHNGKVVQRFEGASEAKLREHVEALAAL